jgi:hypothetical protein
MTTMTRPDGRAYRPRKPGLRVHAWENPGNFDDERAGVIVLGTLDPDEARQIAQDACASWYGDADSFRLADPGPGWYRDGFVRGERAWIEDEQRGTPGVMFTWAERE